MKRLFIFASVVAMSLVSCNTTAPTQTSENQTSEAAVSGDIAYVRSDLVLSQSELFLVEGVALRTKTEKAQASWSKTEQGFQYEAGQLQEKYQKGLITTANAQKQQETLERRMRNYQANTQKEAQALEEENMVLNNRAQDLFRRSVAQLNANRDYKMIFDGAAVIDADTLLDLSSQVLEIFNTLYAEDAKTAAAAESAK